MAAKKTRWTLTPYVQLGPFTSEITMESATAFFGEDPRTIERPSGTMHAYQTPGVRLFYRPNLGLAEVEVLRRSSYVVDVSGVAVSGTPEKVIGRLESSGLGAEIVRPDAATWFL